jgi:hypothetical protein
MSGQIRMTTHKNSKRTEYNPLPTSARRTPTSSTWSMQTHCPPGRRKARRRKQSKSVFSLVLTGGPESLLVTEQNLTALFRPKLYLPRPTLDAIPLSRHEPHRRARPQHAASESAHSMSSRVNKIDINETSRPTNKRPPAHFPDDAAQRSKRTPSGTLEMHLSSFSQGHEKKSTYQD